MSHSINSNLSHLLLSPCIDVLLRWSNKSDSIVLYDSDYSIDSSSLSFIHSIINKSNLYFIVIDKNNVFGGYVNTVIQQTNTSVKDDNTFIFSLIKNGISTNQRYYKNYDDTSIGFSLYDDETDLFSFGSYAGDIHVCNLNLKESVCCPCSFEYNGETSPFQLSMGEEFQVERLIVMQMI
ncbi:hypothetical protein QTN25_002002 [Entamoeba marina]